MVKSYLLHILGNIDFSSLIMKLSHTKMRFWKERKVSFI